MDTRSAISKIGDKLVKAMEVRERFNNRPKPVQEDPQTTHFYHQHLHAGHHSFSNSFWQTIP